MKVTTKKLDNGNILYTAVASVDEVDKALNVAQEAFANQMGIKLDPEKTVAQSAQEQMGIKDIDSIVAPEVVQYLLPFAIDKKGIVPAFPPQATPGVSPKRGSEFTFSFSLMPKPEYEMESYDPVEITLPKFEVPEGAVDEQLAEMAKQYATYEKVEDRPLQENDVLTMALEATCDGKVVEGLSTDGRLYMMGQNYLPQPVDSELVGMKPGDTKELVVDFPDFTEDGQETTKKYNMKITVVDVQRQVIPAITEQWVKDNVPFIPSLDMLRTMIEGQIEKQLRGEYDVYCRQIAAQAMATRFKGKIADEIYEAMRENLMRNLYQNLAKQGKKIEDFIKENGGDQQFGMMLMMQAREMLIEGFALDAVYKHFNLVINDADIEAACVALNAQADPKEFRAYLEQNGQGFMIREVAERVKANKYILENARVTMQ